MIIFNGIGRKQIGESSFDGGSLNNASSRSSAARCYIVFCASTNDSHVGLQYLTSIHDLHALRIIVSPPSSPHSAQQ